MSEFLDPLGRTTGYEYDVLNRLKKTTQPLGRVTSYEYDNNSNVASTTDPKGQRAVMGYDSLDRMATASYQVGGIERVGYQYDYDAEDNLWRVYDSRTGDAPRISTRNYDRRNRVTQSTDSFGRSVSFAFDAADNLKTLTSGRV